MTKDDGIFSSKGKGAKLARERARWTPRERSNLIAAVRETNGDPRKLATEFARFEGNTRRLSGLSMEIERLRRKGKLQKHGVTIPSSYCSDLYKLHRQTSPQVPLKARPKKQAQLMLPREPFAAEAVPPEAPGAMPQAAPVIAALAVSRGTFMERFFAVVGKARAAEIITFEQSISLVRIAGDDR